MLKRLVLNGFKSFADKTVFEFGAGISCIVGPNGSGKSNVVDAVRWVLGEQSAKSLRGKEMADVIFNGSGTRRSLGFAEVSLFFDNSHRFLPADIDELQITRRVYRSGEGEYLINKSPARLRDFRELFLGTGAATEAYSIIEQGKVDVLLQASPKERRLLFEEAAGISRFQARKLESLRKLERVEQNLLRLGDIVEEVERQLRSVKLQAAKARRYQEYSGTLRELRVQIGLADYHALTLQLQEIEQNTATLEHELQDRSSCCDTLAAKLVQVESLTEELDQQSRSLEATLTEHSQEIARLDGHIAYQRAHARDLAGQIDRLRNQSAAFSTRVRELERNVTLIRQEAGRVQQAYEVTGQAVEEERLALQQLRSELEAEREGLEGAQTELMDVVQAGHRTRNELTALDAQVQALHSQRNRLEARCAAISEPREQLTAEIGGLQRREATLEQELAQARANLQRLGTRIQAVRDKHEQTLGRLSAHREERSSIAGRLDVLQDLEERQEGVRSGVQQALAAPQLAEMQVGLVADLVQVDLEHAGWIERALADRVQHIVVRTQEQVLKLLANGARPWEGSVCFLPLDCFRGRNGWGESPPDLSALAGQEGFIAYATSLVRTPPGLETLARHLLGNTIIVRNLADACRMANQVGAGLRWVTADGHILEPDGSICSGAAHADAGLVSRKSQLRALKGAQEQIDSQVAILGQELADHARQLELLELETDTARSRSDEVADELADARKQLSQQRQHLTALDEELQLHRRELSAIEEDMTGLAENRARTRHQLTECEGKLSELERSIRQREARIAEQSAELQGRENDLTAAQVDLAKTEGQLTGLRQRLAAVTTDLQERQQVQGETGNQIASALEQESLCNRGILEASSKVADLYLQKERLGREIRNLLGKRQQFRSQRHALQGQVEEARDQFQQLQEQVHQRQLEASEQRHSRDTLAGRLREDYELELATLYRDYEPQPSFDRDAFQQQIQELRRKIAGLGNVSLQALEELQELETRFATLQAQIDDLHRSKAKLEEIIHKINEDSKRLFREILDSVRAHFGELFRKLFGGGRADILLEDENNLLESGIEIVARPPGKELRSISLLSGGEKTLTAVALLLAVFRSKPSPFCVLDEVDAALDEANIDRFIATLREFLGESQFILITHSKKTMLWTDVLYGITMQESGVSKRVSVRLEDVGEGGEISRAAIERAEADEQASASEVEADHEAA